MDILIIVLGGFLLYGILRRRKLQRQVDLFNKLLYLDKNTEGYIDEINKLLLNMQSDRERNINLIQKTTGLLYAGRFKEAIGILTEKIKTIPPNWQHIYYHNLILCLYFNGETERANIYLEEAKDVLNVYSKKDYNRIAIELIYSIADFYNGKGTDRKDFFTYLCENGRNDYRKAFGYYFLGKINEEEDNLDESSLNFERSRLYGKGSFVENLN